MSGNKNKNKKNNIINENYPVDFVITWVNGEDSKWQQEKELYTQDLKGDDSTQRYRDWEILRFWFRGVEKYAGWVNRIFFVTQGHLPEWLDISNPKLTIVRHEDYIPEEYLPTFNSHTIELNLHRIKGLSENFVYFNDDVFITGELKLKNFFESGRPCDMLALQPVVANPSNPLMSHVFLNNILVISKYFNKRENIRKQWKKYFHPGYPFLYFAYNFMELAFPLFTGTYTVHGAAPLCRRTYERLWQLEPEVLNETCINRIRSHGDVNQYILRDWQKFSGDFKAKNTSCRFRYFTLGNKNHKLLKAIKKQKYSTICINEAEDVINSPEKIKQELIQTFETVFPEKSSFEI